MIRLRIEVFGDLKGTKRPVDLMAECSANPGFSAQWLIRAPHVDDNSGYAVSAELAWDTNAGFDLK